MKRKAVKLLALALAVMCILPTALAEAQMEVKNQKTYAEIVKGKYDDFCAEYLDILLHDDYYSSYLLYENIESNGVSDVLTEFAMSVLGEDLDSKRWIQHLATILDMQEEGFASSLNCMADYDTLKTFKDYAVDAVDIAASAIGASEIADATLEFIATLVDAGSMVLDSVNGTLEQYRYIQRVGRSYRNHRDFLDALINNSSNEDLTEAAKYMRDTVSISLDAELQQIATVTTDTLKITKKHVLGPELFRALKQTPDYLTDPNTKALVDWSETTQKSLGTMMNAASAVYKLGVFSGDMLFGTTDTFKRYAEIKAISEMTIALKKAVKSADAATVEDIAELVPLLQNLCLLRMRGEYCNYTLVTEDGRIMSFFNQLFGDTQAQEEYYTQQAEWLTECWEKLAAILLDAQQLMGNTNDNINNGGLMAVDPVSGAVFYRGDSCSEEVVERFNYSDYSAEEQNLGYASTTQHHYNIMRRDPDGSTSVVAFNACENPSLNVIGGWVYYLDSDYGYSKALNLDGQQATERQYLHRMRPDGTENKVLISQVLSRVWVTQDDIIAVGYKNDDRNMSSFDSASSNSQLLRFTLDGKHPLTMLSEGFEYQDICVDPAVDEIFVGRDMETEDWGAIMEDVSESEIMDGSGLWKVTFSVNDNGASAKSLKLWEDRIAAVNLVNGRLLTVCSEEFGDYEFRLLEIDRDGGQATVLNKNTGTLTNLTAAEDGTLIGQAGNTIVQLSETGEYLGMLDEGREPVVIGDTLYYRGFGDTAIQSMTLK